MVEACPDRSRLRQAKCRYTVGRGGRFFGGWRQACPARTTEKGAFMLRRRGCFPRCSPFGPILAASRNGLTSARCSSVRSDGHPPQSYSRKAERFLPPRGTANLKRGLRIEVEESDAAVQLSSTRGLIIFRSLLSSVPPNTLAAIFPFRSRMTVTGSP